MPPSPASEHVMSSNDCSGDEICVTGISGYFPNSYSVQHLAENLFNKVDLISDDERRWKKQHPEIPQRTGKIYNAHKFDAAFFGINFKEGHTMNPNARLVLERVYECIIDAGMNPWELRHTNTGVFLGACISESEKLWTYDRPQMSNTSAKTIFHSQVANVIAEWLEVTGPSYSVDTACSSSLFALDHAYKAIRDGLCDQAIVAGINLCLLPSVSLLFYRMGILSPDGRCKSFDDRGNGYARSESIVACFLQRAKDSRRVYAKLIHTKTNCDGYKVEGISYPAGEIQKQLLTNFYDECGIPPTSVEYVEAHGTGTSAGDPEELKAIDDVFCTGRKGSLLIGSIKSNLGHSETSSGMNSLAKACIAYNTGYIPPNMNFQSPRKECPSLMEGRLRVVTEKKLWNRGRFALSSFGFGGANSHILMENASKPKSNNGLPTDGIPRLVCVSGRLESSVAKILDDLESRPVDSDLVRLWQAVHERDIPGHDYRGFVLLESTPSKSVRLVRNTQCVSKIARRSVTFKYTDLRTQWSSVAKQCMIIPTFAKAIHRCSSALQSKGIDVIKLLNQDVSQQMEFSIVGAAAVYIGLTDILKVVGVKPDHVVSNDDVDILCAYAEDILTTEQTILAACEINTGKQSTLVSGRKRGLNSSINLDDGIIVEIGFHEGTYSPKEGDNVISLFKGNTNYVESLLVAVGRLYLAGLNPVIANIYPPVKFPVAQGTPMMSHLVEWNHNDDWTVCDHSDFFIKKSAYGQKRVKFYMANDGNDYLRGHTIDDRVIFPGTGYIFLVWESFANMTGRMPTDVPVVFEDVYLNRATNLPKEGCLEFVVTIHMNGDFVITENKIPIVTGRIREMKNDESITTYKAQKKEDGGVMLTAKDFYKELNIRGYQYKGLFRGVRSCSVDGTYGTLAWEHNWITFLDTLLQVKIVSQDSRSLYVPTRLEKLTIDAAKHSKMLSLMEENDSELVFEFENIPEIDLTRAGGCEVRGIHVASINKKPPRGIPVLEKSQFIANFSHTKMELSDLLRCNLQLIHENIQTYKFKNIELVDKEYETNNLQPISENVAEILADMPLVQAEMLVLCTEPITMPSNITVMNKKIAGETNAVLFIGANLLERPTVLQEALATLKNECFVLSRENNFQFEQESTSYDIITVFYTDSEYFVLLRNKVKPNPTTYYKIDTKDMTFSWVEYVKNILKKEQQKIVLYSQGEPVNGLLGLVNCLRKEPGGEMVRGLLIADPTAPQFSADCNLYKEHLDKGLGINVFKDGQWGTYRHLLLEDLATIPSAHAYANVGTIGDLSSLQYFEGEHSTNQAKPDTLLIHVYCSALNFRDAMTALGRVTVDAVARGRLAQDCVQGLEVAGRLSNGTRVMAICKKAISNLVECVPDACWPIPDEWTFEEAVTVPVTYLTVYMAIVMIAKVRRGERILIHAGSGGVGQAAISVALHYGLEVFTTVGTPAKRAFIKRLFPQLKDSHIGNSRDTSFEYMIRRETNGEGVDLVLNSLADDKLQASVKSLRHGGRFLEIGKYDITVNTKVEMCFLQKDISFHGIMMDYFSDPEMNYLSADLRDLLLTGIDSGAVRPLTSCSFEKYDIQPAYRYMAAGKHIGKIVIKMREEEPAGQIVKPTPTLINAIPRYMCNEQQVYVLIGGLGGFGLELADWLVLRGARKILMSSRSGVTKGYQSLRIRIWESYGVKLEISTHDVTTETGCEEMLKQAAAMGPVKAIFNLAVVLSDAIFQNQTPDSFRYSFAPKALTTIHLDKLSRQYCPQLADFIIFSSVSCGRGNAGQTNYGFSNSVMERICEERKKDGLPAIAIQWGAIGDVGLVADMQENNVQLEIGGTLQQRITSCLQVMDKLLKQDVTIASSIVVAEKRAASAGTDSIVEVIAQILGISDMKSISQQAPLSEMGMDSVMAVEIKQTLERDYELFLSAQEIRMLTFAKLAELVSQESGAEGTTATSPTTQPNDVVTGESLDMFVRSLGDETVASKPYVFLNANGNEPELSALDMRDTLFMIPGVESSASAFELMCSKINTKSCILQLGLNCEEKLEQTVDKFYNILKPLLYPGAPFSLLGYSFGTLVTLKLAAKLESEGHKGIVFCLDGSPEYLWGIMKEFFAFTEDSDLENHVVCHSLSLVCPGISMEKILMEKIKNVKTFDEKIRCAIALTPVKLNYSEEYMVSMAKVIFNRFKISADLDSNPPCKINSRIVLMRTKHTPIKLQCNEKYGLDKFTDKLDVHCVEAKHANITDNEECAEIINRTLKGFYKDVEEILQRSAGGILNNYG